jgi:exodeoxyribonuclease VII large subunit
VLPDRTALLRHLAQGRSRLFRAMESRLRHHRRDLEALARSAVYRFPQRLLQERAQRLDAAAGLIEAGREREMRLRRERLTAFLARFRQHRPDQILALRKFALDALEARLRETVRASLARKTTQLAHASGVVRVLSPNATLGRGYSITFDSAGSVVRGKDSVRSGDQIRTRLAEGSFDSQVL